MEGLITDYREWHSIEQCARNYRKNSYGDFVERCPVSYLIGLDLGQKADYTALAILEKHGNDRESRFHCRHLQRFKLGTSYPTIVNEVRTICAREPFITKRPKLAIDSTGVGVAVTELFRFAKPAINASITPITIHGGNEITWDGPAVKVPKRELVSVTQAILQTGRLRIAAELPDVSVLTAELQNFQVEISQSGFDSYNARSGAHDDLVLALAMGLWLGRNKQEVKIGHLSWS
jgi:hypothetical protein